MSRIQGKAVKEKYNTFDLNHVVVKRLCTCFIDKQLVFFGDDYIYEFSSLVNNEAAILPCFILTK